MGVDIHEYRRVAGKTDRNPNYPSGYYQGVSGLWHPSAAAEQTKGKKERSKWIRFARLGRSRKMNMGTGLFG